MAKVVSQLWQMPLLRFDVGRLFGSLVGSSESNMRRAIQVAESISPAVLWIDEIDKAFRGSKESGGSTDAGTSARVFSTFLTWLSEKTAPVFVVATANDISNLPPELLRKGRFDEIFFVDLPVAAERAAIFAVQLRKRNRDPENYDLDALAAAAEGYSGAEIEESVVSALFDAFYDGNELGGEDLLQTLRNSVPLSRTMQEEIKRLREWAEGRARRAAGLTAEAQRDSGRRTLEI
jgi:SpoVK/Ycf46/Vps4 family AAA+-type ATPase